MRWRCWGEGVISGESGGGVASDRRMHHGAGVLPESVSAGDACDQAISPSPYPPVERPLFGQFRGGVTIGILRED